MHYMQIRMLVFIWRMFLGFYVSVVFAFYSIQFLCPLATTSFAADVWVMCVERTNVAVRKIRCASTDTK